jgi:hypothetical protein
MKNLEMTKIIKLIENALRNYMSNNLANGCIFFDKGKYTCEIHEVRGYNCHLYAQIPDEEFKPRYEELKVLYRKQFQPIMDQCKVPTTCNFTTSNVKISTERSEVENANSVKHFPEKSQKVYVSDTTSWWNELKGIEQEMGIDGKFINDDFDGTYRSYHDHLLEYILPENILGDLSQVRENSTQEDKELTVVSILAKIENMFNKAISKK